MLDAVVIGAGAAGIAATRALAAAGRSVEALEARGRVGGRALTIALAGQPVDVGAHWLHMAELNPLVALAKAEGFVSRRAPDDSPLYDGGTLVEGARRRAMRQGWPRLERRLRWALRPRRDAPLADSLPDLGEWSGTFAFGIGLYSGADPAEVSAVDFYRTDDGSNRFLEEGYGALIARLAAGLPIRLDRPATAIRVEPDRVVVETPAGPVAAAQAIVTVPTALLQAGAIVFEPALPEEISAAIGSFLPAAYEHVVVRWPDSPFHANGPDRLTMFRNDGPASGAAMLTCVGGSDLHYVELGGAQRAIWNGGGPDWRRDHARRFLSGRFGAAADAAEILCVSDWWNDPWSRGSWSVCPPGAYLARDRLRHFGGGRIRFASEATSTRQWGTVGGAWREGERAARKIMQAGV